MARKRSASRGRAIQKVKRPLSPNTAVLSGLSENEERGTQSERAASTVPAALPTTGASIPRSVLRSSSLGRPVRRTSAPGLSTDYRYVISDLKRIAVLSAGTFAVLIGLAFVIQ